MNRLKGKTALITGGTSGIGLATAQRFAAEEAHVFITGRRQDVLDAAVATMGDRATGIRGDAGDLDDLDRVMEAVAVYGGGLDILVANAGGGAFALLEEVTHDEFTSTFAGNVGGTLFTIQKALPLLVEGASVIVVGSTEATEATPAFGVYAASKAAVRSLARTYAAELVGRGIRVNTLVPGPTRTPGIEGLAAGPAEVEGLVAQIAAGVPMRRMADPAEIANVALFLASDESSFMTGSEVFADGGVTQV
ncbi:MAG: 3-oxoacyl-[acyl-carrier protein] reductase [uncultured Pseudonocardia sp.]|uniref:3-oxoacyl-[acyl-carrier protein] reductase n=1 Tax=uncultured Pseudonocardia sp. TaxID=211455 RepID=A0A6J4P853_9PSEU|nr:MAG: 3-oxoacyl-[acyl-carrier protein] reductase [uncultured Pseudonocardia sp.]